jgi:HAD superfamily hydrolase (TIGR01509 family)
VPLKTEAMIKNIFFDFGAVLIPIDEMKTRRAFEELGALPALAQQDELFQQLERGEVKEDEFLKSISSFFFRKTILKRDLAKAWNALCHEAIPAESIRLVRQLSKKYDCYLLSNTNPLHLAQIKENSGRFAYKKFMDSFKDLYLSHEMGSRKPENAFYEKVLKDHELDPEECFFVDDREENIEAAKALGIKTWHFNPKKDSIQKIVKELD